jgi:hypothetical protein
MLRNSGGHERKDGLMIFVSRRCPGKRLDKLEAVGDKSVADNVEGNGCELEPKLS